MLKIWEISWNLLNVPTGKSDMQDCKKNLWQSHNPTVGPIQSVLTIAENRMRPQACCSSLLNQLNIYMAECLPRTYVLEVPSSLLMQQRIEAENASGRRNLLKYNGNVSLFRAFLFPFLSIFSCQGSSIPMYGPSPPLIWTKSKRTAAFFGTSSLTWEVDM